MYRTVFDLVSCAWEKATFDSYAGGFSLQNVLYQEPM